MSVHWFIILFDHKALCSGIATRFFAQNMIGSDWSNLYTQHTRGEICPRIPLTLNWKALPSAKHFKLIYILYVTQTMTRNFSGNKRTWKLMAIKINRRFMLCKSAVNSLKLMPVVRISSYLAALKRRETRKHRAVRSPQSPKHSRITTHKHNNVFWWRHDVTKKSLNMKYQSIFTSTYHVINIWIGEWLWIWIKM